VRVRTAEELAIEHTRQKQVIGIPRHTRDFACAIDTCWYRLPDDGICRSHGCLRVDGIQAINSR
jgi:hypothetical protein